MPCYRPRTGYYAKVVNPSGKRSIVFNRNEGFVDLPVTISCGQCIGCRVDNSRKKAIRIMHEASLYEESCFITLTYNPENYPPLGSLQVKDFQDFIKRLRFHVNGDRSKKFLKTFIGPLPAYRKVRYYHCGEYGEKRNRPHYHACIFNFDFDDKQPFKKNEQGHTIYTSDTLQRLWPQGFVTTANLEFDSAQYVAKYLHKKINGKDSEDYYEVIDPSTGEVLGLRKKEYSTGSQGIGKGWFEKYKGDLYPSDFLVVNGVKTKVPKYYDTLLEREDPKLFAKIKAKREVEGEKHVDNNTYDRLRVREELQHEKANRFKRSLDK